MGCTAKITCQQLDPSAAVHENGSMPKNNTTAIYPKVGKNAHLKSFMNYFSNVQSKFRNFMKLQTDTQVRLIHNVTAK